MSRHYNRPFGRNEQHMRVLKAFAKFIVWICATSVLAVIAGAIAIFIYLVPELPKTDGLRDVQFQVPLRVYTRDNKLLAEFGEKRRAPLTLDQVPDQMIKAMLASEDEHFFSHPGVEWRGLVRAVVHLVRTGQKGPGGSTITMQVARNFFLKREKTYLRKLNEILLSFQIERDLSKNEILELYINKIFLGHRAYGVGAAAQVYYGKSVDELTLAQMAMIAGLPQRPSADNPVTNPSQAKARRLYVLKRMLASGFIEQAEFDEAQATPLTATLHSPIVELDAPYIGEMVRAYVEQWAGDKAYTDGFSVYTTVDSRLQAAATSAVRNGLLAYDKRHGYRGAELNLPLEPDGTAQDWESRLKDLPPVGGLRSALVLEVGDKDAKVHVRGHGEVIVPWEGISWARKYVSENHIGSKLKSASEALTPGDVIRVRPGEEYWSLVQIPKVEGALVSLDSKNGGVVALVGGFDFFRSKFNRAVQALRQPGSNFKPFIYSAALEKGFTAASFINDAPVVFDDVSLEQAWRPENYSGKFYGPTRIREALTKSRNLVSIRLLRRIGIKYALQHSERFGFDSKRLPADLSLSLGSGEVTPMEVARGYSVLANGGYGIEPHFIVRIVNARGETVFEANPPSVCEECAITPKKRDSDERTEASAEANADQSTPIPNIAPRSLDAGNAWIVSSMLRDVVRRGTARRALELKRSDLAGKTGTTNDQFDAWFSGYVPSLVATTWVGFDQLAPLGRAETGGRAALPIWIDYMREALTEVEEHIPPKPRGLVSVRINANTGEVARAGGEGTIFETFRAQYAPGRGGRRNRGNGGSASSGTRINAASAAESKTKRLF